MSHYIPRHAKLERVYFDETPPEPVEIAIIEQNGIIYNLTSGKMFTTVDRCRAASEHETIFVRVGVES